MYQIVSDLHSEFGPTLANVEVKASILILAGDIGDVWSIEGILTHAADRWEHVVYVPGNHEYHGRADRDAMPMATVDDTLQQIGDRLDNVFVLINGVCMIGSQRFVGSTLWNDPVKPTGDNRRIPGWSLERNRRINAEAKAFLRSEVQDGDIVITHFMPMYPSDLTRAGFQSRYDTNHVNDRYYGNDGLEETMKRAKMWVSGHTHEPFDAVIDGCRWVCRPLGYPWEDLGTPTEPITVGSTDSEPSEKP